MIILMSVEKTYIDEDEDGDDKDDDTVPHLVSGAVHLSTDGAALLLAVTCLFNASWQELLDRHILNHVHAQLMYAVLYSVYILLESVECTQNIFAAVLGKHVSLLFPRCPSNV